MVFHIGKRYHGERVATLDGGHGAEARLYGSQGKKRVVEFAAVGLDVFVAFLLQTVRNSEKQVSTTTGRVVNMQHATLGFVGFQSHDARYQLDDVLWRVLLTSRTCRNVSPASLDVLFERGDGRVVVRSKVYLRPGGSHLEQDAFLAQFSHDAVHIKELLVSLLTLYAKQLLQHIVESLEILGKILLKGIVVHADRPQRLTLHHNILVVAALLSVIQGFKGFGIAFHSSTVLAFHPFDCIDHPTLHHDEGEERHHVSRKVALFDAGSKK